MAGRLLFVILVYCFHMYQAQDLLPPTLTLNPPVITETDSVTLHCQTPPSVSVSQCYFNILNGGMVRFFPCLKILTGTELLQMSQQRSPAEVQVKCSYIGKIEGSNSPSPHSDPSSITVRTPLPPTLTVNPPVITETDSVTLHCQTPPSVSVSQCYFYTLSGGTRFFPCLKTLTGTELVEMLQQRSPAEVQVKCFYNVMFGGSTSPSPHSDPSSITIRTPLPPPTLTVNPPVIRETDSVTLHCQTPPSVSVSQCYFYTLSGGTRIFSCLKTLTGTELLRMSQQRSPTEVQVKCFYTVKHGGSTSPHSDPSSITIHNIVENESSTTQSIATSKDSTAEIWKFVAVVVGCGVAVCVILLVSAILCNNRRTAGPDEVKRQDTKVEYSDTYHMYRTVPEEPAASDLMMGQMYSTVQSH